MHKTPYKNISQNKRKNKDQSISKKENKIGRKCKREGKTNTRDTIRSQEVISSPMIKINYFVKWKILMKTENTSRSNFLGIKMKI